jgi:hypothetical protein
MPVERFGGSHSITFVAMVTIKPEHERDYIALVTAMTDTVLRKEPGTSLTSCTATRRSRTRISQ